METLRINTVMDTDGQVILSGLPFKKGESIELTVQVEKENSVLTAKQLIKSELIGLWGNRKDIGNSARFARQLRNKAQQR